MPITNIALLTPTRQRIEWFKRMAESAIATADEPDHVSIVVKLDTDDFENHTRYRELLRPNKDICQIGPTKCLSILWNDCYEVIKDWADIFCHCGDDLTFNTIGWDTKVRAALEKFPKGIGACYGDDLLQHEGLATHGFYSKGWIEYFGKFCPYEFAHDFNDAVFHSIGSFLKNEGIPNAFIYMPDVITEHHHHSSGKAPVDDVYKLAQLRRARHDCNIDWRNIQPDLAKRKKALLEYLKS